MKQEILLFPITMREQKHKQDPDRLTVYEIYNILEQYKTLKNLVDVLDRRYLGRIEGKEVDGHYVIKVKFNNDEFGLIVKKPE